MSFDLMLSNGDVIINSSGDVAIVTDQNKLIQDVIKIIITEQGTNIYHPMYGSLLNSRIIGQTLTVSNSVAILTASVNEAMTTLITLQKEQQRVQALSPAEQIVSVNNISVSRDPKEPRQLNATLTIKTGAGILVSETLTVRVA